MQTWQRSSLCGGRARTHEGKRGCKMLAAAAAVGMQPCWTLVWLRRRPSKPGLDERRGSDTQGECAGKREYAVWEKG